MGEFPAVVKCLLVAVVIAVGVMVWQWYQLCNSIN